MNKDFKNEFEKTAGIFGSIDDMAKASKRLSDEGIEIVHKLDEDQLKKIIDTVKSTADNVKPTIKPIHLLGASMLAGAGFPLGQWVGNKTKDVVTDTTQSVSDFVAQSDKATNKNGKKRLTPSVAIYPRKKIY